MTWPAYHLVEDTFACLADDQLVFSDLRNDKYRCLNPANTQLVLRLFPGFGKRDVTRTSEEPAAGHEETRLVMEALVNKGLFVHGSEGGKPVAPVVLPAPAVALPIGHYTSRSVCRFGHRTAFLQASLKASGKLRLQSLRRTVHGVEHRRRRGFDARTQDYDAMLALVAIFHRLRPFYPRSYICRFDSLALVEFLACYRHFPKWVFGVRVQPFGAHCWVQENDCVLNDSLEYIAQFTPIMGF